MKRAIFLFLLLVLVLLLGADGYSWYAAYNGCLQAFINTRGAGYDAQLLYNFLTPQKFERFRYLLLVYTLIPVLLLFSFNRVYGVAAVQFKSIASDVVNAFKTAFNTPFRYLLIIPLLTTVYLAVTMPVNFDEALTYMWFTSKGLLSSVGYYPAPNNHILHSVITCFTKYIPFIGPVLCLRVSSLVAGLSAWVVAYAMLSKHFNKNMALAVVSVSSMLFMSLYYSYLGRGYALSGLFFITAFYAVLNIINGEKEVKHFVCFGLASVLGFYTMPSFLYAFIMLNVVVVLCNRKAILNLLLTDIVTSAVVLLLYMPVVIINGLDALTNNTYVAPLPRNEVLQMLPWFTPFAVHEITGIGAVYFAVMLAVSFIMLLKSRSGKYIIIFLVFIAGPFALVLAHSVIRYSRTFSYYCFVLVFLVAVPWQQQFKNLKTNYLLPALIILQFMLLARFGSEIYLYEHYSQAADRVIHAIAGNKSYFCDEPMFEIQLQFKLKTGGYRYTFANTRNVPVSADTLTRFDYVIIRNECDSTVKRVPQIKGEYYAVY